jgi:hypothetical protein
MSDIVVNSPQKFASPQAALAHYGKKGMKWGVRNEGESGRGRSSENSGTPEEMSTAALEQAFDAFNAKHSTESLQAEGVAKMKAQIANDHPPKQISDRRVTKAEKSEAAAERFQRQADEYREKLDAVGDAKGIGASVKRGHYNAAVRDSEIYRDNALKRAEQLRSGKLTSDQKMLIGLGAAAVLTIGVGYAAGRYQQKQAANFALNEQKKIGLKKRDIDFETERNRTEHSSQFRSIFGHDPDFVPVASSEWAGGGFFAGFSNKKAMDRPEFTIPKDTLFQRLSNHPEDSTEYGVNKPVYSTFLSNDKKVYGASGEFGSKGLAINFTAKGDTRVPNINTTVAHLKQVLKSNANDPAKAAYWDNNENVLTEYKQLSGGSWSSPTAQKLFTSLKSFGYSAIVDDMDAGYLGDAPVVFFGDANSATHVPRGPDAKVRDAVGMTKLSGKYA